ncbi:AAA family ATPase [Cohnella candidum]|uniref:AAA family ATPase n=1 Tax=Cohnella candidum TaxID=2674991 RepID=UPI0013DE2321|nr:AAA family ATPase [Cohnella candidum]
MDGCCFQLLGGWKLSIGGEDCTGSVPGGRARLLLAYLALAYGEHPGRRQIAFAFWPDSSEKQALSNLRKLLHDLRATLPRIDRYLVVTQTSIHWNPDAGFHCDAGAFMRSAQGDALEELLRAETLYRGELLPGFYEDWLEPKRESFAQAYVNVLEKLTSIMENRRDYKTALHYAGKLLIHQRTREETYRTLMRLHALNLDTASVTKTYRQLARTLQDELGIGPSGETTELLMALTENARAPSFTPSAPGPLIGRIAEWDALSEAWRQAADGRPSLLALQGEAGIGKTRLAEEFRGWAERQGIRTAMAVCLPSVKSLSYSPVKAWLRSLPMPQLSRARLSELARLLPELLDRYPDLAGPNPIRENWQLNVWYEAIERMLLDRQPLLLLLDNLQWSDGETLQLLAYLLRSDSNAKLLVIATMRTEESMGEAAAQLLNALRIERKLTEWTLAPLSEEETKRLIAQSASDAAAERLGSDVYVQTGGNPLFIVETMRDWQSGTGSRKAGLSPVAKSIVEHRLGKLTPVQRRLAAVMAAVGKPAKPAFLAAVADMEEETVAEQSNRLASLKILREVGGGSYDFTHDLIRETAYRMQRAGVRRKCHGQIARCLTDSHRRLPESAAAEAALHYELAEMDEEAILHYETAALAAEKLFANETRIQYYRKLMSLQPQEPLLPVVIKLGEALLTVGDGEEAERTYRNWLERYGYTAAIRERSLCDVALGHCLRVQGRYGEARFHLERALDYFSLTEDQAGLSLVYGTLGYLHYFMGQYEQARNYLLARLRLPEVDNRTRDDCRFYHCLGFLSYDQCEYEEALGWFKKQIRLATDIRDRQHVGDAMGGLALVYLEIDEMDQAFGRIVEKIEISRAIGTRAGFATAVGMLGKYYQMLGSYVQAQSCIAFCLEESVRLKDWHIVTVVLGIEGSILLEQRRYEEAAAMIDRAIRLARKIMIPFSECDGLALKSLLMHRRAQIGSALEAAEEALRIADRLSRKDMQISLRVRRILLESELGRITPDEAIDSLERLMESASLPQREAEIRFAQWKLKPESPDFRTASVRLNEELYRKSGGKVDYLVRCREMGEAPAAIAARPMPRFAAEAALNRTVSRRVLEEIDRYLNE